ncbi:hypothetical protein HZZ13_13935 [Bradyrhizobium sp. CNPSo 4010]|uniref:DUF4238 domain-containing protein n=1 Tax=Bradyrhizobium agreste TaxID=2751811 RepID=A0ABS0PPR3_9BRAD|nr:hypothetical protein [Bradyrhizobium agreste]MBH5398882.1 hypothetical protein [Bradyrhizobium agreste]
MARGLSGLWKDREGKVTRLSWDRTTLSAPPKQFGAITNGHHIKLNGPWAGSIEPLFDDADSVLPSLAAKLEGLSYVAGKYDAAIDKRITAHEITPDDRKLIGEGLASLLVRCPAHRHQSHLTTERFAGRTGDKIQKHDDTLIALNINQYYRQIVQSLERGGKIVLLRSGEREFVMGEGYLNTLAGYTVELWYQCLVPLTPSMAVLAFAPCRYWTNPPICTIGLNHAEVDLINEVTQVYSRDYIFYRNEAPKLIDAFTTREFRNVQYHRFDWLDAVMQAVAAYAPRRGVS